MLHPGFKLIPTPDLCRSKANREAELSDMFSGETNNFPERQRVKYSCEAKAPSHVGAQMR